jgi:MarR family transcriptional regulator, 2-MHQ and catechol-resistance regulon repressor
VKTIDDEIKASKFNSAGHKALINLFYTYNVFNTNHVAYFNQFGILPQHYNVLRIIMGRYPEPVSPSHILNVIIDKGLDLTRLIDKLVLMGIVRRAQNPDNKRITLLTITDQGKEFYDKVNENLDSIIYHGLDENESEQLSFLMDKMRTQIKYV